MADRGLLRVLSIFAQRAAHGRSEPVGRAICAAPVRGCGGGSGDRRWQLFGGDSCSTWIADHVFPGDGRRSRVMPDVQVSARSSVTRLERRRVNRRRVGLELMMGVLSAIGQRAHGAERSAEETARARTGVGRRRKETAWTAPTIGRGRPGAGRPAKGTARTAPTIGRVRPGVGRRAQGTARTAPTIRRGGARVGRRAEETARVGPTTRRGRPEVRRLKR